MSALASGVNAPARLDPLGVDTMYTYCVAQLTFIYRLYRSPCTLIQIVLMYKAIHEDTQNLRELILVGNIKTSVYKYYVGKSFVSEERLQECSNLISAPNEFYKINTSGRYLRGEVRRCLWVLT